MDDWDRQAGQHQANRRLGLDRRPANRVRVELDELVVRPVQLHDPGDPDRRMIIGDQVRQLCAFGANTCFSRNRRERR